MSSDCVGEGDTLRGADSRGLVPWRYASLPPGSPPRPGAYQCLGTSFVFFFFLVPLPAGEAIVLPRVEL